MLTAVLVAVEAEAEEAAAWTRLALRSKDPRCSQTPRPAAATDYQPAWRYRYVDAAALHSICVCCVVCVCVCVCARARARVCVRAFACVRAIVLSAGASSRPLGLVNGLLDLLLRQLHTLLLHPAPSPAAPREPRAASAGRGGARCPPEFRRECRAGRGRLRAAAGGLFELGEPALVAGHEVRGVLLGRAVVLGQLRRPLLPERRAVSMR